MLSSLITLLSSHLETVSARQALLRSTPGLRAPLLKEIVYESGAREFLINMLTVLARDPKALDALLDAYQR